MAASPDLRRYVRMLPPTKERTVFNFTIQDPDTSQWRTFSQTDVEPWKLISKGFADLLEVQTVRPYQHGSPRIFIVCDSEQKARYDAQEKAEWLSKAKKDRPDLRKHEDWTQNAPSDPVSLHGVPEVEATPPMTETDELKSVLASQQEQIEKLTSLVQSLAGSSPPSHAEPHAHSEPAPDSREALLGLSSEPPPKVKGPRDDLPANHMDDLTKIDGIGPKLQEHLNADGIYTFDELAMQDSELLAKKLDFLQSMGPRRTEKWIWAAKRIIEQ